MNSNDPFMTTPNEHCIDVCNGLLRSELSALETYRKAIDKYAGSGVIDELRRILADHSRSATSLAANVRAMGGKPERDTGSWGRVATAVQGAAMLFGQNSAIESLQRGEEASRTNYQIALLDDEVMPACKLMIREELLPPIIEHVTALDRLEHAA